MPSLPRGQLGALLALAILAGPASAQKHTVIPLLPAANWHLVSAEPLSLETVRQWGGDPAIEREFGVKAVVLRRYHLADQNADMLLEQASDPSSAYGLFTFYRSAGLAPAKGMELALLEPENGQMARGRYFIRVRSSKGAKVSEDNLEALLILVGGTRPTRQDIASLPPPLPPQGLVAGSEKYLLGLEAANRVLPKFRNDLIGFAQGAEAQLGTYIAGNDKATVLAITYPTPQIARARYAVLESLLGLNQARAEHAFYGRRTSSIVLLVLDSSSESAANKLMDQFQVTAKVSWNERAPNQRSFTLQVVQLVLANIMLSFIISAFAFGGGVIVFLSRRAAMKWFPDSWADPEHDHIIRIKLN